MQKEKELAEAEEQIEKLKRDLNLLEEALENGSKRAVPTRSPRDSPVSPDTKRTKMDEPIKSFQTSDSKPVLSPFQDQTFQDQTSQIQTFQNHTPQVQTFQNHTPQVQTFQNHTPQVQTIQNHTPQVQTFQNHTPQVQTIQNQVSQVQTFQNQTPQTVVEGIVKENIKTLNTQSERPELVQITSLQTKEIDSDLNPVIPMVVRPDKEGIPNEIVVNAPVPVDARNAANLFAESAEKTRAAQTSLIESFKKKRKECPEDRNENLYLDSDGDLVEMVSSRSPSAQKQDHLATVIVQIARQLIHRRVRPFQNL
jgi:hypothetical protein